MNAATIDVSDDGVLQGVTFKNHVLPIAACAEEIMMIMTVVKHRAKIKARCCFRYPWSLAHYTSYSNLPLAPPCRSPGDREACFQFRSTTSSASLTGSTCRHFSPGAERPLTLWL